MLVYNPEDRISAKEALHDPWLLANIGHKKKVKEVNALESFDLLHKFSVNISMK